MPVPVFYMFFVLHRKSIPTEGPNTMKLFDVFFWNIRDPRSFGGTRRPTRWPQGRGHALGGRARHPGLWAPRGSVCPNSWPINSHIFRNPRSETRNNFIAAASLCSEVIPSGALFWHSAGGGIIGEAIFINLAASMMMCE